MKILAIETTCDETAAAVVASGPEVLSDIVYSQIEQHEPYGGVVPEIASRSHLEALIAPTPTEEGKGVSREEGGDRRGDRRPDDRLRF